MLSWMRRLGVRGLCSKGRILLSLLVVTAIFFLINTEIAHYEHILWRSLGAVIDCTEYEKEATRALQTNINFFSGIKNFSESDKNAVTLVTQLSLNRLAALMQVIKQWDGFVSAAVYITKSDEEVLKNQLNSQPIEILSKTDVHIIIDDQGLYPINYLRNVALNNTRTDYVFLSDVDFIPVPGLHTYLIENIKNGILDQKQVLVIPAFKFHDDIQFSDYPVNKNALIKILHKKVETLCSVQFSKRPSQCPTMYDHWFRSSKPYVITYYHGYEPYIVMRKSATPPYDQGFVGRELDKVQHLLEVHAKGYKFIVVPDVYIIHFPHAKVKAVTFDYWCPRVHFIVFMKNLQKKYGRY